MTIKNRIGLILMLTLCLMVTFHCQSQEISMVNIKYVDVNIQRGFIAKCGRLEYLFKGLVDSVFITNRKEIAEFSKIIKKIEEVTPLDGDITPNVRIQIEILQNHKKSYICMSHVNIQTDKGVYRVPKDMIRFLKKYIPIEYLEKKK